jgi:hypothetical protein
VILGSFSSFFLAVDVKEKFSDTSPCRFLILEIALSADTNISIILSFNRSTDSDEL